MVRPQGRPRDPNRTIEDVRLSAKLRMRRYRERKKKREAEADVEAN